MENRRDPEPFVSPTLVRVVASVLLAIGLLLIYIVMTNYSALGVWPSIAIGISGVGMSGCATLSLITADPAWILLDLIMPY